MFPTLVLFRSSSDWKQMDIQKDYPNFMTVYRKETAKPYGYVLINNQEWETSQTIDKKRLKLQHSRNRLRYKLKNQKTTKPKAKKKDN